MNNRAFALATGVFLILLTGAIVAVAFWMGGSHKSTRPFLVVTTEDVAGLQPQSTISYRGIAAGTVQRIQLDPRDARNILIDVEVDTDIPVTRGTYAKLKLQGITGQSLLQLDDDASQGNAPLPTSSDAPGHIPMRPSLLDSLGSSTAQLAMQLQKLAASLNELLDADNRGRVKHLLAQADAATGRLAQLEADLDVTARKLPELDRQSRSTLAALQQAANNINHLGDTLNRELTNGGLQQGGEGTLQQLDATLQRIDQAAGDIHHLAQNLTADPQGLLYGPSRPAPGPGEQGYQETPP
ncbi:MAG TPA: MlaD family protein [Gammaproteobacteria bacterium]|jgi:phospholipid/cholesterol/gamma-HCH transport system substrate-binding protein